MKWAAACYARCAAVQLSRKIELARECPMCGGEAAGLAFPYGTLYNGREFIYYRCGSCESTYVSPIPSEADFVKMYSRENYHDCHYHEICLSGQYADSVEYLRHHVGNRRTLLDFGCGNGAYVMAAANKGFDCTGIEFQASAIKNAREKSGRDVISLEAALSSGKKFSLIHLADVLEHLPNPVNTIETLRSLLLRDGVFYIEGPLENHRSMVSLVARSLKAVRRAFGDKAPGTTPPTHLFRVNARNQKRFFTDRLGYECLTFHVYETGWPYLSKLRTTKSASNLLKLAIAGAAIALSNVVRLGQHRVFGNRFRSIFKPPNNAEMVE